MAELLDVGLDKKTLSILIALCEHGVNPEALAAAVKELQREASEYKVRSFFPFYCSLKRHLESSMPVVFLQLY